MYQELFPQGISGWGVKLTTHLNLVSRSRICGSVHLLPMHLHVVALIVKNGDNFTFY
jgi:hypothetical protein